MEKYDLSMKYLKHLKENLMVLQFKGQKDEHFSWHKTRCLSISQKTVVFGTRG